MPTYKRRPFICHHNVHTTDSLFFHVLIYLLRRWTFACELSRKSFEFSRSRRQRVQPHTATAAACAAIARQLSEEKKKQTGKNSYPEKSVSISGLARVSKCPTASPRGPGGGEDSRFRQGVSLSRQANQVLRCQQFKHHETKHAHKIEQSKHYTVLQWNSTALL